MKTAEDAFLEDIFANKSDDAPRLIFADWLEEHDDESRAEFIRVQCGLEPLRCWEGGGLGDPQNEAEVSELRRLNALRRRERELLRRRVQDWIPPVSGLAVWTHFAEGREPQYGWLNKPCGAGGVGLPVTFRRGFVAEVTCTLADWCGPCGPCGRCAQGWVTHDREGGAIPPTPCPVCGGWGCAPGHGPALVRAAPVERVTLSDRRPWGINDLPDGGEAWWFKESGEGEIRMRHDLPGSLWDYLIGEPGNYSGHYFKTYRGEDHSLAAASANDDLSAALIKWAEARKG